VKRQITIKTTTSQNSAPMKMRSGLQRQSRIRKSRNSIIGVRRSGRDHNSLEISGLRDPKTAATAEG
jgi:hypothetical protein